MELRELQTFVQVAGLHSFSRAAEKLGYSQAAVTLQIKQLERELAVRLFERIGKQVTLTYEGELLLGYAGSMLRQASEARDRLTATGELQGRLRIGAIESICASILPGLLTDYHRLHPAVLLDVITDSPAALLDQLGQNRVDVVYLLDRRVYNTSWVKRMEHPDDIVFVAAAGHPLACGAAVTFEQLLCHPLILTERDASYRFLLEQRLASLQLAARPYLSIGNTEFIVQMLLQGLGISFLPQFVAQPYLATGQLATIQVQGFSLQGWRQIFHHKDKWVTGEMQAFIQLATTQG